MNPIKKTIASAKEFVSNHKTAITIVVTATATTTALYGVARACSTGYTETVTEFIAENGLTDKFKAYLEEA